PIVYVSIPCFIFLFTHPAATEFYTLSLHDALPILAEMLPTCAMALSSSQGFDSFSSSLTMAIAALSIPRFRSIGFMPAATDFRPDRKSTRLNSSHVKISYAVFCLKKKKSNKRHGLR